MKILKPKEVNDVYRVTQLVESSGFESGSVKMEPKPMFFPPLHAEPSINVGSLPHLGELSLTHQSAYCVPGTIGRQQGSGWAEESKLGLIWTWVWISALPPAWPWAWTKLFPQPLSGTIRAPISLVTRRLRWGDPFKDLYACHFYKPILPPEKVLSLLGQ